MQNKKYKKKNKAFTLIEVIISLAIFSVILTSVLTITISMINAEKQVQAELFLTQTAYTTIESMSRQLRYGYNYTGSTQAVYDNSLKTIIVSTRDVSSNPGDCPQYVIDLYGSCTGDIKNSQMLVNAPNSPFILFESQNGNPNDFLDQNAFCAIDGKLYKISKFEPDTTGINFTAKCGDQNVSQSMLPDNITLENISFDVYGDDSENPRNPMVRIKLRLKHEQAGAIDIQTTVSQRLITYF